jgi:high-affinity K+ transport system ATPase subunit B
LIPKENNLLPMVRAEDASERLDVVRKLQASGEPIAFIGQSAIDAPGLAQANLSLVANVGNESLMSLSHVANASGDQWRFRHLFILGKELNLRRTDLTALCIASATAVWIAVIPYFGETVTGVEAKLSWITNPLGFSSLSAAIISAGFVTSMNLLLMASSIIGLHDKEGRFFRWANLLFSGPSRTLQTFVFSLIALKILAVLTTF